MGNNLPPGVTPGDIDRHFGEPRDNPPEPEPDRPECSVCGRPLPWSKGYDDTPLCDDHDEDDAQAAADEEPDVPADRYRDGLDDDG